MNFTPKLDDRDFEGLVESAKELIRQRCPEWDDLSPNDPGIVLVELFAHMTELMIYRLNLLPEKAYVEFLKLIGVKLLPPSAASTRLTFSMMAETDEPLIVPAGYQVASSRTDSDTEPIIFATDQELTLPPGHLTGSVMAHHCDLVKAELLGRSNGNPGQVFVVKQPPIIAPLEDHLDLAVAVEILDDSKNVHHGQRILLNDKVFEYWREVQSFGQGRGAEFICNRVNGTITFSPKVTHQENGSGEQGGFLNTPSQGSEIRAWYRCGGGAAGNVSANVLTIKKEDLPGVNVANLEPATGGRSQESMEQVLVRGPEELHSRNRAIAAQDYELIALKNTGTITRAKAFAGREKWCFAQPGSVELIVVPRLADSEYCIEGGTTKKKLVEQQVANSIRMIEHIIDERKPLGTSFKANWVRYKEVYAKADIVVHRGEDADSVRDRVLKRLYALINPLPAPPSFGLGLTGWPFGESLRASDIYNVILQEPGVRYAENVRLYQDDVPESAVTAVEQDCFQPLTWWACSQSAIFRSLNNGDSWEQMLALESDEIGAKIRSHPREKGVVACATNATDRESRVVVSSDLGATWSQLGSLEFQVEDIAWLPSRNNEMRLLLATRKGLYVIQYDPQKQNAPFVPQLLVVDPKNPDLGFYACAASFESPPVVAVTGMRKTGVFVSFDEGLSNSFQPIAPSSDSSRDDVRELAFQQDGPRKYLWAGTTVSRRGDRGMGCKRCEIFRRDEFSEWQDFNTAWQGGSCYGLAVHQSHLFAATFQSGVLMLNIGDKEPQWQVPNLDVCGLPSRIGMDFAMEPVHGIATGSQNDSRIIMAGGPGGIFRSTNEINDFESSANSEHVDSISLPDTWLFCSGVHQINVIKENIRP